nr:MAG TPA: hypothetical protein [Microviridae sp.]
MEIQKKFIPLSAVEVTTIINHKWPFPHNF